MTTRTIRRHGAGGVIHVRQVRVQPPAPPECAWCRSEDRVQLVGITDKTRPGPWDHRHETTVATCPDHLWLTFAINRGELHGPFA